MKRVIVKYKGTLNKDNLHRIEAEILKSINDHGLIVLDNEFEVIVFDDGKDETDDNLGGL